MRRILNRCTLSLLLRRWLAVAVPCGLAACALVHHDSPPLAEIAPTQIRLADDIHLAADGWPQARWWTTYGDAQLDALIERALIEAPTIAIAQMRVAQARSNVDLVKAGSGVQIVALAAIDREYLSSNGFLGPFAGNQPLIGANGPWYTAGLAGFGADLDIDLWGKQRALIEASAGEHNARVAESAAIELELAADVAQIYYEIQTNRQLVALLEQQSEVAAVAQRAHAARMRQGLESRTASELARAQQLAAEREIVAARTQITLLRESLRALVGAGPDSLPDIAPASLPTPQARLPSTLAYGLLARRPDLQAMHWYVQSSLHRVDAAKAAFYPNFDIKAFFGVNALHLNDLFTHASQQINVIPGLYLPVFDSGRLNANLGSARSASNALIAQYNQRVLEAVRDVATTASRLQDIESERLLQSRKVDAVSVALASVVARYGHGLVSQADAEEAKSPVILEKIALLKLEGQKVSADIALNKALGGGYRQSAEGSN
ncbi:MdtP family multidrug efflux transporter outer membrane subunit [Paraburkholderia sp. 2C]